ncbi:MAG: DUF1292 domain-containing protein [Clostridia bacterium]|nr:DUF1292 domain-containing protein [Clostridia bacterium]
MNNNKMFLEFDDGVKLELEIMGVFDVNGVEYIALVHQETKDVYLYRYIVKGETFEIEDIPDDEYDIVEKNFHAIINGKA